MDECIALKSSVENPAVQRVLQDDNTPTIPTGRAAHDYLQEDGLALEIFTFLEAATVLRFTPAGRDVTF